MKKAIFLGLFIALSVPFISQAAFDTNLKYGSSSPAVKEMQEFLTSEGVYNGPITGNFYALTHVGVKAFQTKEGISPVSGYWGPLTRAKATAKLELSASDIDEQTSTGTVVTPTVSNEFTQLLSVLLAMKNAQTAANTQPTKIEITNVVTKSLDTSPTSIIFNWNTSIPTNGKITLEGSFAQGFNPEPVTQIVLDSKELSTSHEINATTRILLDRDYTYTIESIAKDGITFAKYTGVVHSFIPNQNN